jgi:hypothetical protein
MTQLKLAHDFFAALVPLTDAEEQARWAVIRATHPGPKPRYPHRKPCPHCGGSGESHSAERDMICGECDADGTVPDMRHAVELAAENQREGM